jgi:HAD superfamily hydrolase (TIGR01509 family)
VSDIELVIFDCDGVLVDSERISVRVGTGVLAELGWTLTEREFADRFVGCSSEHFRREVAGGLGQVVDSDWEARFSGRYRAAFEADLQAVPGVAEVLDALAERGIPFCVASNSDRTHVEHVLTLTGLGSRFAGRVFSAEDVRAGKPAPDLFLLAARSSGVAPGRTVVVEDSPFGVRAAVAAGMRCLGYGGGLTPAHRLVAEGARVFTAMEELASLLSRAAIQDHESEACA